MGRTLQGVRGQYTSSQRRQTPVKIPVEILDDLWLVGAVVGCIEAHFGWVGFKCQDIFGVVFVVAHIWEELVQKLFFRCVVIRLWVCFEGGGGDGENIDA